MKKKLLLIKELLELPVELRMQAAEAGVDFDPEIQQALNSWAGMMHLCSDQSLADRFEKVPNHSVPYLFGTTFWRPITESIRKGDGTWLRKFADAIERRQHPLDTVRNHLGMLAHDQRATDKLFVRGPGCPPAWQGTAWECCDEIKRRTGKTVDIVLIRRLAKEMGLALKADRKGRKPTPKLKPKKAN